MDEACPIGDRPPSGAEFEHLSIEFHRQMTRLVRWMVAAALAGSAVSAALISGAIATLT